MDNTKKKSGFQWGIFIFGGLAGIIGVSLFLGELHYSASEKFCISCHEMEANVYMEYKNTSHYLNKSGVRATCSDCHLSNNLLEKVGRKVKAVNEVIQHFKGTIDTREKFLDHRLELATKVWAEMKANDSRECRSCHTAANMDYMKQSSRAMAQHIQGEDAGKTCIECHKGIAHRLPDMHTIDPSAVIGEASPE
ncbi:MAG: NapC/NirT family cytochrome c [Desulfobulbaceae bacterium]|jgi:cytochrome c-type protein NapC|nr:NapC/NirT family cytochrome c [Desulfobulbaceae bacterium]